MIEIGSVEVSLAGERVLKDVTASAEDGFVGVVGPNGAGKTTLMRSINGTETPDDGVVRLEGDDVGSLSSRETARRVATMPQNTDVSFEFSVEEVVRMGRHPHVSRFGTDTSGKVRDAMERVDIARFADRSVHEVSGGERQRVLLARCLAQDADVLLLDEPTASLDVGRAVETLSLVRSLVDGGRTVVAAIHDLNLAARFCDELVLVDDGRVVSSGAPEDVLTQENVETVFGTSAVVERDTATGSVRVTALGAERAADGGTDGRAAPRSEGTEVEEVRVHYAGNNLKTLRALKRRYEVSVGVVPEGSAVAEAADGEVVSSPPFERLDDGTLAHASELADEAVAVVRGDGGAVPETDTPVVDDAEPVEAIEEIRNRD